LLVCGLVPLAPKAVIARPAPSRSAGIADARQLRIDPTYLAVGSGWTLTADQSMDSTQASTRTIQGATVHPSISYASLESLGLYYEESAASVPNSTSSYWITYLGSYYSNAEAAGAAFRAVLPQGGTSSSQPCTAPSSLPNPSQCGQAVLTPENPPFVDGHGNRYSMKIRVIQVTNALFEYGYVIESSPEDLFDRTKSAADSKLDLQTQGIVQLFTGGTPPPTLTPITSPTAQSIAPATPGPTSQPTSVPISYSIQAQWQKPSPHPIPGGTLTAVTHGARVEPVALVTVMRAPATDHLRIAMVIKRGSTIVLIRSRDSRLGSHTAGLHRFGFVWRVPSKAGIYRLVTRATIGSTVKKASAVLKVS
jgi:hypothetical protein